MGDGAPVAVMGRGPASGQTERAIGGICAGESREAALGHMVRDVGKNNSGHRLWIWQEQRVVNGASLSVLVRKLEHCHRNS